MPLGMFQTVFLTQMLVSGSDYMEEEKKRPLDPLKGLTLGLNYDSDVREMDEEETLSICSI